MEEPSRAGPPQYLVHLREIDFDEIQDREFVGRGSFGTVYKAQWQSRDVAVKEFDSNADRKAIETEVKQLSRVVHPNIIALFGVSVAKSCIYLIMEYAEDGSLYNFLHGKSKPYYTAAHAMSWARQCAEGVAYLHGMTPKALIHRDLKPPNLLLLNNARDLKICDFGTVAVKSTLMTNNKGSAAWMAPEVFETSTYTEKCDVFSWGIVLWEVLSREQPFKEVGHAYSIMWKVHQGHRPPLMEGCPKPIEHLITSCWDTNPANRPSMAEIVNIMKTLCQFFPGADEPLNLTEPIQPNDNTYEEVDVSTINNTEATNSLPVDHFTDTFSNQSQLTSPQSRSPIVQKPSSVTCLPVNRWQFIPEEEEQEPSSESPYIDTFRLTPSKDTLKRMEEIRNGFQQSSHTAEGGEGFQPLLLDVDPNAWDLGHGPGHDADDIFNSLSKSDGKERLTVTETKPVSIPNNDDVGPDAIRDDDEDDESLHLMLDPELQPEPPLPNSRLSQEIYHEHTKLAKEYLRVDTELYYAEDRRNKILAAMSPEEREEKLLLLKKMEEKEELLALYNDLQQQLATIQASQRRRPVTSPTAAADLTPTSSMGPNTGLRSPHRPAPPPPTQQSPSVEQTDEGWVFISQNSPQTPQS